MLGEYMYMYVRVHAGVVTCTTRVREDARWQTHQGTSEVARNLCQPEEVPVNQDAGSAPPCFQSMYAYICMYVCMYVCAVYIFMYIYTEV